MPSATIVTTWLLVATFNFSASMGGVIAVDFGSEKDCQRVLTELKQHFSAAVDGVCTPKVGE